MHDKVRLEFAHPLEFKWGLPSESILESIARASDLTQRGVRGVIAEAVFVLEVLPTVLRDSGWRLAGAQTAADIPFDALVEKGETRVRIQVKNQRTEKGVPKLKNGCWVAEVQKTRSGKIDGLETRPYRFNDFDLLAVCLWPAKQNWKSFAYCLARDLTPRKHDENLIEIMQQIPQQLCGETWGTELVHKLEDFCVPHRKDTPLTLPF